MFYFASDNSLAPGIVSHLKALKQAGFHPDASVVVHFDPNAPNEPVHIFDVNLVNKLRAGGRSRIGFPYNPPRSGIWPRTSSGAGSRRGSSARP